MIYLHLQDNLRYILSLRLLVNMDQTMEQGNVGNFVVLDDINVFNVTPCTYYGIEDYIDASCNGG